MCCRDRPHAPFRCLDAQYRRELVRVYLTNVETICRKFVDEKKADLIIAGKLSSVHDGIPCHIGPETPP